ncbi:RHS repeat-associated core domain-containing protein [Pseudomonas sp. R1-15]|uniref:RHS repeat-associated core domain-containing protein n=1 Tax=Pseudomonas sp. R1-15 TaxID=2817399 RepID=UPI003DA7D282
MNEPRKITANVYVYDPLDRLVNAHSTQRFYKGTRIATEIQGERRTCFFEHEATPLAELHPGDVVSLLATDQQRSVLHGVSHAISQPQSYAPYGHRPKTNGLLNVLGFNGERPDPVTGHYLLGQGHRSYNPILMRFNSPDSLSPFDEGGINSYAYCSGDPINYIDPTGTNSIFSLISDGLNLFRNRTTRAYYKSSGKLRARASSSLANVESAPRTIAGEDVVLKWNIKYSKTSIKTISKKSDLGILEQPGRVNKYVLNKDNTLVVGSIADDMDESIVPSHASIIKYAATHDNVSREVVSAGYIIRSDDGYIVTNHSGHYMPKPKRTTLAKFKLRALGVRASSENVDFT